MKLYDIGTRKEIVNLETAIFKGLANDGSLYMPTEIPRIAKQLIAAIEHLSFQELSYEVAKCLIGEDVPSSELRHLIEKALNFPAPLHWLGEDTAILELFHGPSMAFKDFGARFMAQLMSYFLQKRNHQIHILVATSGDTGGAVAAGFHSAPGILVSILYPSGKVSPIQEKQLTTWGENITALEVQGNFDDCQAMVKQAFTDPDLSHLPLSSANSINIARLIPQSFYYFEAFRQIALRKQQDKKVIFSVPSGNFGNLTAGLMAKKMGLPVHLFLAATNINRIVPDYLKRGIYQPAPSQPTISNAMDVGNPSNFSRMIELYGGSTWNTTPKEKDTEQQQLPLPLKCSTWNIAKSTQQLLQQQEVLHKIQKDIIGYSYTDQQTLEAIQTFQKKYHYLFDPHGAIAMLALQEYKQTQHHHIIGIALETAHPAKFIETIQRATGEIPQIPKQLAALQEKEKRSVKIKAYEELKEYLLK